MSLTGYVESGIHCKKRCRYTALAVADFPFVHIHAGVIPDISGSDMNNLVATRKQFIIRDLMQIDATLFRVEHTHDTPVLD